MRDKIFKFVIEYKESHDGNTPSSRMIGAAVGLSQAGVIYHLNLDDRFHMIDSERCVRGGQWMKPEGGS